MSIGFAMVFFALAQSQALPAPPQEATVGSVTVSGARATVESRIDRRSYSVGADLQAQTGAIADALRNIPSVQIDLQGNVSLRGNANITVLVDGKPSSQFSGEALAQALQSLPASQIERIEVMTNPSAEFRADGSGGVINLVMKKASGAGKTASVRAQVNTSQGGMVAGNVGYNSSQLSLVADGSYRRDAQNQLTVNASSAGALVTTDLLRGRLIQDVANGHLGAEYDLSPKTRLSSGLRLSYFYGDLPSLDDFEQEVSGAPVAAFTRGSVQEGWQHNSEATAGVRHTWSEDRELSMTATYSTMVYQRRRLDQLTPTLPASADQISRFDRHTDNRVSAFRTDYRAQMPGEAELKLGYDFQYSSTRFEHGALTAGAPDPSQTGLFLDDETRHQIYVTYQRPVGKLDTLIGLRGDRLHLALEEKTRSLMADHSYGRLYPSLHLNYDLSGGRKLTASYSRRVDRPAYALLDPIPYPQNPGFALVGNMDLRPQNTDSLELGFDSRKDAASFAAILFYRQTRDAFSSLYTNQPDGTLLQQFANAGRQTNGGLELVVANKLTPKLTYSVSFDAYWSELTALNLGIAQTRQAVTGFGRANLNWQLTSKDFVQFNVFVNGKTLLPQGYVAPFASGNIGYRYTLSRNVSWMFVIQDPFKSVRTKQVLAGVGGANRRIDTPDSRMASLTLVWNFSGKPSTTDFDFKAGGYGGVTAP